MVVLSGDMFHENKPSRATVLKTIKVRREGGGTVGVGNLPLPA